MDTTTTCEFECPEHNMNVLECECKGYYCRHGEFCSEEAIKRAKHCNKHKTISILSFMCPCGAFETFEEVSDRIARSRPEIKSPDKSGEDRPGNWYLITLTQPDIDKTIEKRIKAAKRVIKSKQVSPEQWCYSIEFTAKGTPHVHIALFTYKYPEYRIIKGFNDGYGVDIQREKFNVKNYVVKNETKPSEEWLKANALDSWFFCSTNYSGPRPQTTPSQEINSPDLV